MIFWGLSIGRSIDKFEQYAAGGVAYYWIIDAQQRTIEAYRLAEGSYVACDQGHHADVVRLPPFNELDVPLSKLWRPE